MRGTSVRVHGYVDVTVTCSCSATNLGANRATRSRGRVARDPLGRVIPAGAVTTADLYRQMILLSQDMTRALTLLDSAASTDRDHEGRIRILERFRYTLLGVASAVGIASGVASSVIAALITRH